MSGSKKSSAAKKLPDKTRDSPDLAPPIRVRTSLSAHLLDIGLPDLGVHPGLGAFGLVYLDPLTHEDVFLLGVPAFAKPYVCVAPVSRLQGCLARRPAGEDADLVAISITQGKVSSFLLFLEYGKASHPKMNMFRLDKYINLINVSTNCHQRR